MTPRFLFTVILILGFSLAGCGAPAPSQTTRIAPTASPLTVSTVTVSAPLPEPTEVLSTSTSVPEPTTVPAQIPNASAYSWTPVISGLTHPSDIQPAGDGSGRLFVLEQPGRIRIFQNGSLFEMPFLDITDRVGSKGSEQGLLGLAFHPKFAQNGWFYVNYTDFDGNTHIARFTASGDSANPASEKSILFVQQPFQNHNGGALAFGPDGNLYIGLGDGGSAGDPYGNAQSGNSLLGKILRIDVDRGAANPEIWASGLRNPWRFSYDHLTGDLWIGDVGQNLYEEVDFVAAGTPGGLNFGWKKMEGNHPYKGGPQPEFTAPVAEYSHAEGCAITGGYVYRGVALPAWQGVYFYGDYCSGTIWGLTSPPFSGIQPTVLFQTGFKISTFGVDEAGELYLADYTGAIYRLEKIP